MTRSSLAAAVRRVSFALVLLLGMSTVACYHRGANAEDAEPVYVDVTNHNPSDMNIYLVHAGMRIRLGTVTTEMTGHFKLKAHEFGDGSFQLLASPLGGSRGFLSEMVYPQSGQTVTWTLEVVLIQSTLTIQDT